MRYAPCTETRRPALCSDPKTQHRSGTTLPAGRLSRGWVYGGGVQVVTIGYEEPFMKMVGYDETFIRPQSVVGSKACAAQNHCEFSSPPPPAPAP
jgi:hypothetical protein